MPSDYREQLVKALLQGLVSNQNYRPQDIDAMLEWAVRTADKVIMLLIREA